MAAAVCLLTVADELPAGISKLPASREPIVIG
jgi:hypothetical protein